MSGDLSDSGTGTGHDGTRPDHPGLYVTTSGGVVYCRPAAGTIEPAIESGTRRWTGFFGIARHPRTGTIWTACRARLGTRRIRKHSTDVILYAIDPRTRRAEPAGEVPDVHDVHQIAVGDDHVFLTDTGLNRIHIWNLTSRSTERIIEVGPVRDDVNHLNALLIEAGYLLVGMNNRGREPAAIMRLPLDVITGADREIIAAEPHADIIPLTGFEHTHDLEPWRGSLLACASHDGMVLRTAPPEVLFSPGGWVRGLASEGDGLWVGISTPAERADRHSRKLDGDVRFYRAPAWQEEERIHLPGVGQVHDLLRADPEPLPGP